MMDVRYNCTFNCLHGMIKSSHKEQTFQFPGGVPMIKTPHTQDFSEHSSCSHFGRKRGRVWEAPLYWKPKTFHHLSFYNQHPTTISFGPLKGKFSRLSTAKEAPVAVSTFSGLLYLIKRGKLE